MVHEIPNLPLLIANVRESCGWVGQCHDANISVYNNNNDNNHDSDDDKAIVCISPLPKYSRGGGIGPPIIFITLVKNLINYDLDEGSRDGGRRRNGKKYVFPPIGNGGCLMSRLRICIGCCLLLLLLL